MRLNIPYIACAAFEIMFCSENRKWVISFPPSPSSLRFFLSFLLSFLFSLGCFFLLFKAKYCYSADFSTFKFPRGQQETNEDCVSLHLPRVIRYSGS